MAFTVLGISGVINAINIIDGFNGLSAGYATTALAAIIAVAFQVNDHLVLSLAVTLLAGLLGFLCWNWPRGQIFMGDGGAYLVGFSLAELSILLLYRNESVSPWFTASIMAYPIFETLFSMFRRKFLNKTKTGEPDAEHLHQLIFKKVVLKGKAITPELLTHHNSHVALYVWAPAVIVAIVAVLFWQSTAVLMPLTIAGCVAYVLIYRKLLSL
jgi:UDP-N-acetylmuramyl pentapeptide phosphotransferase/UDP-N-acetylglucosamine-1-phosphate transferase